MSLASFDLNYPLANCIQSSHEDFLLLEEISPFMPLKHAQDPIKPPQFQRKPTQPTKYISVCRWGNHSPVNPLQKTQHHKRLFRARQKQRAEVTSRYRQRATYQPHHGWRRLYLQFRSEVADGEPAWRSSAASPAIPAGKAQHACGQPPDRDTDEDSTRRRKKKKIHIRKNNYLGTS